MRLVDRLGGGQQGGGGVAVVAVVLQLAAVGIVGGDRRVAARIGGGRDVAEGVVGVAGDDVQVRRIERGRRQIARAVIAALRHHAVRIGRGQRLAVKMKMDRAYLSEIENGHRKPTVDLLDKLAEALDVPFHELFLPPEPGAAPPKALPSGRPRGKT